MGASLGVPARGGRGWRIVAALALLLGLVLGALGSPGRVAAATTIDIPGGDAYLLGFGLVSVGQTIIAPAVDTVLTDFTVSLETFGDPLFRGEVYAWDGEKVAGPPLYSSPPALIPSSASRSLVTFAIPGGVQLAPGGSYALIVTNTTRPQNNDGLEVGKNADDVYAGGTLIYSSAGRDALATTPWNSLGSDLELYATFVSPPPPPTAATVVGVTGTATAGGASVALRAAVARQSDGAPVPAGGAVTFTYNGGTYNGTTDANGVATATAPLPPGTQTGSYPGAVRASYSGTTGYAPSQGEGPLTVAAGQTAPATPATMVDATGTATAGGSAVALAAAVARQSDGAPVPANGSVTFTYNGSTYAATTDAQGVARATAPLPAGTQPGSYPFAVKAAYAGAPGYAASEGQGPLNVAAAACSARFADVADTDPACPAIIALVNRGVIYGYATDPPTFGPLTKVQRAQVAAFLVRALGWSERPQGPRTFSDLGPLEGTDLARAVRIVANACDGQGCVAQGPGDGTFQPTKEVTKAEVVAFLARAFRMDPKYAWSPQPGAAQPHSGVPAAFDTDVRTYNYYAGSIPDAPTTADGWNAPASRAWVARVLYQALATKP